MITARLVPLGAALLALAVATAPRAEGCGATYTVQSGDTLSAIATRCGTTVEQLVAANPKVTDPASISIGWELTVPGRDGLPEIAEAWARERDARAAPVLATGRYTVEQGDSMASIATETGVPLQALLEANADVDPFALQPGHELVLPGDLDQPSEVNGEEQPADGTAAAPAIEDAALPADPVAQPASSAEPVADTDEAAAVPERLSLEGYVRKGAECPVLKTPEGDTYSLVSQQYGFAPGDYVAIEAEPVEMSFCMEGQTVRVTLMTPKEPPNGG